MRLLSTHTHAFQEFISDYDIPEYAILSHTWEAGEEVTYQEWQAQDNVSISHKKGFIKIEAFRAKALCDGFDWVWVDTCCIDKTSSAELSEAINSMFRWYRDCSLCYTYLADVQFSVSQCQMEIQMSESRWFTRGWTLQELIAPRQVWFFTDDWRLIGEKANMTRPISKITGIDFHVLWDVADLDLTNLSVAKRMSWASQRKTTRTEDMAYCLLGIFDVNLPLIYGEGIKAFQRLQEAIMLRSPDQSLFAWGEFVDDFSDLAVRKEVVGSGDHRQVIRWEDPKKPQPAAGLFAETPQAFRWSGDISPLDDIFSHQLARAHPPVLASGGVRLGIVIWVHHDKLYRIVSHDKSSVITTCPVQIAVLACQLGPDDDNHLVGFMSYPWGSGYYARTSELVKVDKREIVDMDRFSWGLSNMVCTRHFMREGEKRKGISRRGTVLERIYIGSKAEEDGPTSPPDDALLKSQNNTADTVILHNYGQRLSISFQRQPKSGNGTGDLLANVMIAGFSTPQAMNLSAIKLSSDSEPFIFCDRYLDTPLIYITAKRELLFSSDGVSWEVDIVDLYISLSAPSSMGDWVQRAENSIYQGKLVEE